MYNIIITLLMATVLVGFSSPPDQIEPNPTYLTESNQSDCTKAIAQISGMTCSMCAQGIKIKLLEDPRISTIDINFEDKLIGVNFNQTAPITATDIDMIVAQAGYKTTAIDMICEQD